MIFRSPHPPVDVPDATFTAFVLEGAEERSDRAALIDGPSGRSLGYGALARAVRAAAVALADRGLEAGDVVAVCSPNLPEYAVAFNAVATAGGCTTTLNPLQTADEIVSQLQDSGARYYVTVPPLVETAREVAARTAVEEVFVFGEAEGATPFASLIDAGAREIERTGSDAVARLEARTPDPDRQLVALPYSSGTTGRPKGVMLTHRNLVANITQTLAVEPLAPGDVAIAVLPFFHIYGMVVVMGACLRAGATVVTLPRFELENFLETIQRYRVTHAYLVPPILLALARHPVVDEYDLSSLKLIMSGAAPLPLEVAEGCRARIGCPVVQGYGLTETSPVTHICPPAACEGERIGSVGPTVPNTEMCIVDLESGERLPPGREGEVWVRGPQVMAGYLNRPDATARTIDGDGWLHTGDVGVADEDGYLRIVDRAKELIKYKGYQVAPAELEDLLLSHPAVRDVAVIPMPDPEAGEVPKAYVVRAGEVGEEELKAHVAGRVAPYKKIRAIEFTDVIPKSPSGKILRRLLVAREREKARSGLTASAGGAAPAPDPGA